MSATRNLERISHDEITVWSLILAAWGMAVVLTLAGQEWVLNHDVLIDESSLPWLATLVLFLSAWQLMTAGMMVPTSLPLIRLYSRTTRSQSRPRLLQGVLLGGYFAVWTGFAVLAFLGDTSLHALVDRWQWLDQRSWLIAGSTLILAGAFQFSDLKERCLQECRSPQGFLWRHYGQGASAAWRLGVRHGLFCLGCCWALMLVMFGLGVGSLAWMVAIGGVMLIEKTSRRGRRLMPFIGVALLIWGGLVLLQVAWLPSPLSGSA